MRIRGTHPSRSMVSIESWISNKLNIPVSTSREDEIAEVYCGYENISRNKLLMELMGTCYKFVYNEGLHKELFFDYLSFYHRLLTNTAGKGLELSDALIEFKKEHMKLVATYTQTFLVASIDFIVTNLIQHYHLISFILCDERETDKKNVTLDVAPVLNNDLLDLKSGIDIETWKIQESIKKLEEKHKICNEDILKNMSESAIKLDVELNEYIQTLTNHTAESSKKDQDDDQIVIGEKEKDSLTDLIRKIVMVHAKITANQLEGAVAKSKELIKHEIACNELRKSNAKNDLGGKPSRPRKSAKKK